MVLRGARGKSVLERSPENPVLNTIAKSSTQKEATMRSKDATKRLYVSRMKLLFITWQEPSPPVLMNEFQRDPA